MEKPRTVRAKYKVKTEPCQAIGASGRVHTEKLFSVDFVSIETKPDKPVKITYVAFEPKERREVVGRVKGPSRNKKHRDKVGHSGDYSLMVPSRVLKKLRSMPHKVGTVFKFGFKNEYHCSVQSGVLTINGREFHGFKTFA